MKKVGKNPNHPKMAKKAGNKLSRRNENSPTKVGEFLYADLSLRAEQSNPEDT